jgi:hypothetical protein
MQMKVSLVLMTKSAFQSLAVLLLQKLDRLLFPKMVEIASGTNPPMSALGYWVGGNTRDE